MSEAAFENAGGLFKGRAEEFLEYYRNNPSGQLYVECCRRRITEQLPLGRHTEILDVGSGIGYITSTFAAEGHQVTLYDRDTTILEFALEFLKEQNVESNVSLIKGEIEKLDAIEDDSFDLVVSFSALNHCEQPFLAVKEMSRVCKPGGKIICSGANYLSKLKPCIARRDIDASRRIMDEGIFEAHEFEKPHLVRVFKADELWAYFGSAGTKVEWVKGSCILQALLGEDELNGLIKAWGLDECVDLELQLSDDPALTGAGEEYWVLAVKEKMF